MTDRSKESDSSLFGTLRDAGSSPEEKDAVREEIISRYKRLVYSIAIKKAYGHEVDDLVQSGFEGLMRAIEKFEPDKGASFPTYANFWIQSYIGKTRDEDMNIRIPQQLIQPMYKIKKVIAEADGRNEYASDIKKLAEKAGVTEKDVMTLLPYIDRCCSIDASPESDEESTETYEGCIAGTEKDPCDVLTGKILSERLSKCVGKLSDREAYVIRHRYGLENGKEETLQEIGGKLGCTRQNVKQIEARGLKKLNMMLENER